MSAGSCEKLFLSQPQLTAWAHVDFEAPLHNVSATISDSPRRIGVFVRSHLGNMVTLERKVSRPQWCCRVAVDPVLTPYLIC